MTKTSQKIIHPRRGSILTLAGKVRKFCYRRNNIFCLPGQKLFFAFPRTYHLFSRVGALLYLQIIAHETSHFLDACNHKEATG